MGTKLWCRSTRSSYGTAPESLVDFHGCFGAVILPFLESTAVVHQPWHMISSKYIRYSHDWLQDIYIYIYIYRYLNWLVVWNMWIVFPYIGNVIIPTDELIFPQQQNALGSSAIVKVSEQTGAAPKPIPPRFPGSKYRFPVQVPK